MSRGWGKRLLRATLLVVVAFVLAACGFTSVSVAINPSTITVIEDTKEIDFTVSLALNGAGFVTVDTVAVGLRNSSGELVYSEWGEDGYLYVEILKQTIPSGVSTSLDFTIPINAEMVEEHDITELFVSVSGTRPSEAVAKIVLMTANKEHENEAR